LGKQKILSADTVIKILIKNGFSKVRQKGSHIVMQKKLENSTITVPVPNHKELKTGTLKSIIRQSKIPITEFDF